MNSKNNILLRIQGLGSKLLTMAAALLLVTSCSDEKMRDLDEFGGEGNVTIKLSSLPAGTRAEDPDDSGNENLMQDALICIFKAGASADTDRPVVMQTVDISAKTEKSITLQVNKDKIDQLFPEGVDKAIVHVFANLPATTKAAIPANPTLGDLKALSISSNFASRLQPMSFVMNGDSELTIQRNVNNTSKDEVAGTVRLKRAAAKISLNLRVKSSVTDLTGREWTPVLDGAMQVFITNGVSSSAVTPSLHTLTSSDYYFTSASSPEANEKGRSFTKLTDVDEETGYPYALNAPFYTYPNQWTEESETMTFMTLLVPWECKAEGSYRSCYYMVPVVRDQNYLDRNVSYRVSINIDILGNSKPDDPLVIEDASYRAVAWGSEPFNVAIKDFRYLVIDNNTFTMNNEGLINIPFYSSHETVIKYDVDTLNYYLFNTTAAGIEKTMAITNTQRNNSTTNSNSIPSYAEIPGYSAQFGTTKNIYNDWIDNNVDPNTNTRSLYFQHELYQWTAYSGTNPVSYGPYEDTTGWWGNVTSTAEANANASLNNITRYQLPATLTDAYSRYRMTITIVHKDKLGQPDEAQFSEKIVIWQYPAMYIEVTENYYGTPDGERRTPQQGNMYVNDSQTADYEWYQAWGLGGTTNANPNQYVISVTQLADKSSYQIGDPRITTVNNLTNGFTGDAPANGWANAPGIEDANTDNPTSKRKLRYYYPTDQNSNKRYVIAPKIRVASSYGVCPPITYAEAQRRCASYQELQYPAGRWRIPTVGEIEYIMNLSAQAKIPTLFSPSTNEDPTHYWSAQGIIESKLTNGKLTPPSASSIDNEKAAVRCVYDEWYWEGSTIKTTQNQTFDGVTIPKYPFVWGDRQR